jgi:selenocysteine lyase/cysteine desulfurase
VTVYGLPTMEGRVPTFLINVDGVEAADLAAHLVAREIGVWAHGSFYAPGLYERLGYGQAVRVGFIHYNTAEEVDRLIQGLDSAGDGSA